MTSTTSRTSRRIRIAALSAVATITLPLALLQAFPAHAAPSVGAPDTYATPAGSTLTVGAPGVLANDSDADGTPLGISGYTQPAHGALTMDQTSGAFSYTPSAGFSGADSFEYYLFDSDEADNVAGPFFVSITVTGGVATMAPVAVDDAFTVDNAGATAIAAPGLLANDSDGDSSFTVSNWTNPAHGSVSVLGDGSFSYQPTAGYVGADAFTYRLTDGQNLSEWATVTLTVEQAVAPVAPVAVDDLYSVSAGSPLTIPAPAFTANDTDADSSFFIFDWTEPSHGTLTYQVSGDVIYAPAAGFVGTDSIEYRLMDPQGNTSDWATVTFEVGDASGTLPPVALDDAYTVTAGTTLSIAAPYFLANDTDPDSLELEIGEATEPAHGTVVYVPDGPILYTPDAGFTGTDTMTYRAMDGNGNQSNWATVTFTVVAEGVAAVPVAVDDFYSTTAGTPLTIPAPAFFANDTDADSSVFTFAATSEVSYGWVEYHLDGSATYYPGGFVGTETMTYRIQDPEGNVSNVATVTFTVLPLAQVNTAPVAVMNAYAVAPDATLTVPAPGVLSGDSDADGDALTVASYGIPSSGTLTGQADGSFVYVPEAGFVGTVTIPYVVTDGIALSAPADIVITVEEPRDDEPTTPGTPDEPGLPTQSTRPEGEGGGDGASLAATGADAAGAAATGGLAALLLALGLLVRRLSRREV